MDRRTMDQIRNFTQTNKGSIMNVIYIVAAVVLVYYLVMYYFTDGQNMDKTLLANKLPMRPSAGYSASALGMNLPIVEKDGTQYRAKSEYTISFWMYINDYTSTDSNVVKGILSFFGNVPESITSVKSNVFVGLHPTQPKMIVRYGNLIGTNSAKKYTEYTKTADGVFELTGANPVNVENAVGNSHEPCDVMDVDIQRWINVTISVNGRIMDVYMDGKLARSCIMENIQHLSQTDKQTILIGAGLNNTFSGYISGVVFSNYAVTPDVIYGRYQAGPYTTGSFLDYLKEKIGIRISYTGTSGETKTF